MTNLLEILFLSLAICLDSFMSAFGYGISKIKIPFLSALIMASVSTFCLAVSCLLGLLFSSFISATVIKYLSFSLLLIVGLFKFFSELLKLIISKKVEGGGQVELKLFNFKFYLHIIADSTKADIDKNKILSSLESLGLGFLLAIDSLGVGLSFGMQNGFQVLLIAISFLFTLISIVLGACLGKNIAKKIKLNLSFLSGLVLIILAFIKLF